MKRIFATGLVLLSGCSVNMTDSQLRNETTAGFKNQANILDEYARALIAVDSRLKALEESSKDSKK